MTDRAAFFRALKGSLSQKLRTSLWFPRWPLSLAVFALGAFELEPLVRGLLRNGADVQDILQLMDTVFGDVVHGVPKVIVGLFLVIMSVGLLLRSRLAWIVIVLIVGIDVVLSVLAQTHQSMALTAYSAIVLLFLIVSQRYFQRSSIATASLFATASILSLLAYAIVGTFVLGAQFSPPVKDFGTALYFSLVTMSTVGYGDILPKTPEARLFVVSIIILGITVFATSLSTLLLPLVGRRIQGLLRSRGKFMGHSDHYIIVSQSALARNSYKELKARGQEVLFILDNAPEHEAENFDYIVGNGSDLDVLRRAHAGTAKAVLALSEDDSEIAFVVLAVKEMGSAAKTVAVVNDARNLSRAKWVRPDVVIAPTVLGGELLAMALSGESLDNENLMERLLQFGS